MKVIVGCDHAGFEYKKSLNEYLSANRINFNDLGTNNCDSVDYPDYAHAVAKEVQKNSTFVGNEFVSQVRSMKEGKIREKPIHGQGTNKEIQELRDEGIDVLDIPWISDDH